MFIKNGDGKILSTIDFEELTDEQKKLAEKKEEDVDASKNESNNTLIDFKKNNV